MTQTGEQPPRWYADHEPETAAVIRRQIDELRVQRETAEPGERVALQMRIYSLTNCGGARCEAPPGDGWR